MSYKVYTAEYLGEPNHVSIFVDTGVDDGGLIFHVTGTILQGMIFEKKSAKRPDQSVSYVKDTMKLVGHVQASQMVRFEEICRSVPPPGRQVTLGGKRLDPSKPLYRCGEWVEDAKKKLGEEGLISK